MDFQKTELIVILIVIVHQPHHRVIANTHAKVQILQRARFPRPSQRKSQAKYIVDEAVKMETAGAISPTLLYVLMSRATMAPSLRS
jgi:hypothetical protein